MALDSPGRVLIVMDHELVAQSVALTLNHRLFVARITSGPADATSIVATWRPHLAMVEMDLGDDQFLEQLGLRTDQPSGGVPVIGLTRRDDLQSKLTAFAQGVDDIMTVPFSPEELLARALALVRRVYGEPVPMQ